MSISQAHLIVCELVLPGAQIISPHTWKGQVATHMWVDHARWSALDLVTAPHGHAKCSECWATRHRCLWCRTTATRTSSPCLRSCLTHWVQYPNYWWCWSSLWMKLLLGWLPSAHIRVLFNIADFSDSADCVLGFSSNFCCMPQGNLCPSTKGLKYPPSGQG